MATRFAIGLYTLVALAVFALAACGDSEDISTPTPSSPATPTPALSPTATATALCLGEVTTGPVAIIGTALEPSDPATSVEPGFENTIVTVLVQNVAVAQGVDESYEPGDEVQVVLLGDLITRVNAGDCVFLVGQSQRWACGPDCEDFGFVASRFEVRGAAVP